MNDCLLYKERPKLDMRHAIQKSVRRLEGWHSYPEQLDDLTEDVLGQAIPVNPALNLTVLESAHETVLKPLVGAIISVYMRHDPSPEDIVKAQTACLLP